MAVTNNNPITIADLINQFKTNCENLIDANSSSGTIDLPPGQVGVKPTYTTPSSGNIINASTLVILLSDFVYNATRIRNVITRTYRTGDSTTLYSTVNGRTIFNSILEDVPNVSAYDRWERDKSDPHQSMTLEYFDNTTGKVVKADNLISFFQDMYSKWNTLSNNPIIYNKYICHNSCHSSHSNTCHNSHSSSPPANPPHNESVPTPYRDTPCACISICVHNNCVHSNAPACVSRGRR